MEGNPKETGGYLTRCAELKMYTTARSTRVMAATVKKSNFYFISFGS